MKKYRLTLKNSQAIVPGDDISRHDVRLAPARTRSTKKELRLWTLRSISYRKIASSRKKAAKQHGKRAGKV